MRISRRRATNLRVRGDARRCFVLQAAVDQTVPDGVDVKAELVHDCQRRGDRRSAAERSARFAQARFAAVPDRKGGVAVPVRSTPPSSTSRSRPVPSSYTATFSDDDPRSMQRMNLGSVTTIRTGATRRGLGRFRLRAARGPPVAKRVIAHESDVMNLTPDLKVRVRSDAGPSFRAAWLERHEAATATRRPRLRGAAKSHPAEAPRSPRGTPRSKEPRSPKPAKPKHQEAYPPLRHPESSRLPPLAQAP